jgi:hypothetical protein
VPGLVLDAPVPHFGVGVALAGGLVAPLGRPVAGLGVAITFLCGLVAGLSPAVAVGRVPVVTLGDLLAPLGRLRLRAPGLGVRRSPPDSLFVSGTANQQPPGAW